jgi:hypothetical protein
MAEVKINPVADGNKTNSGINGALNAILTGAIYAGLKYLGIDNAEITALIVSGAMNGILAVVGIIHKFIKARTKK